jgi:diguanylate cyclase
LISVLTCIGTQHDPWLVALGAVVICIGAFASMQLIVHALAVRGILKFAWLFLAAMVVGTATWTTHFVAILAYVAKAPVSYDPTLTILSLLIAICGADIALVIASAEKRGALPAIGGGLLGLTIAVMHYEGMLAYKIDGMVRWHDGFLVASVIVATVFGALSMAAVRGQIGRRAGMHVAAALLVVTTLGVHFIGMTAIEVIPFDVFRPTLAHGALTLALATALTAVLIFAAGGFAYAIDDRTAREAQERMARMALTDALTGLPNRAAFTAELEARARAATPGQSFAVLAFEIAAIDAIGLQFGASMADRVIQAIAGRLVEGRKSGVFLARTASAQFCGVGQVIDHGDTSNRARQLHAALARELLIEGHDIPVDVRIGAAMFPDDAGGADLLLRKARGALARALADPLEPIRLHDEAADATVQKRLALANDLRGALERGELELFYQPQVWIDNRRVTGYEALLRWRHPEIGVISPAEFIPIAEKTGSILPIGHWALRTACEEAATWPEDWRVAVNVSPLQLRDPDLPERVREALEHSGLAPDRLEIELTESLLIDDRPHALDILQRIKALGVRLALDDFGTGYSSMEVLRQVAFDKVKLDKSFIDDVETDQQARAILHAMVALGRELSIGVLAEGVESERQLAILRNAGCRKVQGYLTGRPMPASAIERQVPARLTA